MREVRRALALLLSPKLHNVKSKPNRRHSREPGGLWEGHGGMFSEGAWEPTSPYGEPGDSQEN